LRHGNTRPAGVEALSERPAGVEAIEPNVEESAEPNAEAIEPAGVEATTRVEAGEECIRGSLAGVVAAGCWMALDVAVGPEARLQGSPREGLESRQKPSFHCEPEISVPTPSAARVAAS
jgi:hypothetical protein